MLNTIGKLAGGALAVALAMSIINAKPTPEDPRYAQILQCEVALKAKMADPESVVFPNFLLRPGDYHRGENNAFEPMETFQFRAKNEYGAMTRYGAYCAYGLDGRLAAADIE